MAWPAYNIEHEMNFVNYTEVCSGNTAIEPWTLAHNVMTGIKAYGGYYYVSVPRWRPGVPSTLNRIPITAAGARKVNTPLEPFPNCAWNQIGSQDTLSYVQSFEIDPATGYMYVLDTGRRNFIGNFTPNNTITPKVVVFDLNKQVDDAGFLVNKWYFPEHVAPNATSFLNDIVLDVASGTAYISDALGTIDGTNRGAIVSLDLSSGESRRFVGPSTGYDPDLYYTINPPAGFNRVQLNTATDGIAMHPTNGRVYYCALQGTSVYSVDTEFLSTAYTDDETSAQVQLEGSKVDMSDGMTFDSQGDLYFGGLNNNAFYKWELGTREQELQDAGFPVGIQADELNWVDTFGFREQAEGEDGNQLVFITNHLNVWFDQPNSANPDVFGTPASSVSMRIVSFPIGNVESYMQPSAASSTTTAPPAAPAIVSYWWLLLIVGVLLVGFLIALVFAVRKAKMAKKERCGSADQARSLDKDRDPTTRDDVPLI